MNIPWHTGVKIKLLFLLLFNLISSTTWASCFFDQPALGSTAPPPAIFRYPGATYTLSTSTHTVGSYIGDHNANVVNGNQVVKVDCNSGSGFYNNVGTQNIATNPSNAPTFDLTSATTLPTPIPGIGYNLRSNLSDFSNFSGEKLCILSGYTNYCQPYSGARSGPYFNNENPTIPPESNNYYKYYRTANANLKLSFYVIGALTPGSYTINSGTTLGEVRAGANISSEALLRAETSGIYRFNVTQPCTVTTTNISVSLGTQKANQFVNVGDASTPTAFDINLTGCSASSVHITITGTADPNYTNAATNGVLATTGGATGVGIQLRRRDTSVVMPLNQDNTWTSNYTSGSLTLPMEARYIKNNVAVTAGQANATATFTMSYP